MLYMQEGILSRLAASPFVDKLILKGGFLIFTYAGSSGRTTKDIDFLGQGIPNDETTLSATIAQIVGIDQDDGLLFDVHSIETERITEGADYHGVRVFVACSLGSLRNRLQIDVGFGDAISQGPSHISIPGILGRKAIEVEAYPLATIIAEKFEIMIVLGSANSRMKDFFDVAFLLGNYELSDKDLKESMIATFSQRRTEMPDRPYVFAPAFVTSDRIQALWAGFLKRALLGELDFLKVVETIRKRLEPLYEDMRNARE